MMDTEHVLILGAGGHGHVVADILLAMRRRNGTPIVVGFLDDNITLLNQMILGIQVRGPLRSLSTVRCDTVVVALGDNHARLQVAQALFLSDKRLFTAIHPAAVIGTDVRIGAGAVICAGAVINAAASVGIGAIVNTGAIVEHHCVIGDYSHLAPGARLGGGAVVGAGCLIGIGATILPRVTIGDRAIVGAGATVFDDVTGGLTVVGSRARAIQLTA